MSEIKNEKVAMAFDAIADGEDYRATVANALTLLAHVVDAGERVDGRQKRVECNLGIDSTTRGYHIVCEEIVEKKEKSGKEDKLTISGGRL